jgi:hypothetical protein
MEYIVICAMEKKKAKLDANSAGELSLVQIVTRMRVGAASHNAIVIDNEPLDFRISRKNQVLRCSNL